MSLNLHWYRLSMHRLTNLTNYHRQPDTQVPQNRSMEAFRLRRWLCITIIIILSLPRFQPKSPRHAAFHTCMYVSIILWSQFSHFGLLFWRNSIQLLKPIRHIRFIVIQELCLSIICRYHNRILFGHHAYSGGTIVQ